MASRLAEIYRSEKSTGGGLGSAVGKRLKEKIDPRQALDQSGLLVSMFPSLKTYKATKNKVSSPKISSDIVGSGIDNDILNSISATSSLTAKNSMSLPMMARDMNLMKLNIFKLVKLQGGSANTNKTDIFWNNAKARESSYENTISKITGGGMIGKMAKSSFAGRQKRDGQSPDSALFVTGGAGGGVQASEVAEGILTAGVLKKIMTSTVGFMTSSVGLSILGVAAGGVAIAGLARKLQDDQIDKAAERGDVGEVKQQLKNQTLGGESELYLSPEDSVAMDKALNDLAEDRVNKVKKPTKLEIEAQAASERLKNLPDTGAGGGRGFINPNMPTGAGGGRGFVNPTLVTPEAEAVPSNVVRTASGDAIRSGSGGYVTSGTQTPAPAAPTPASSMPTGPKPPSPTPSGKTASSYIQKASAMIVKEEGLPKGGKAYFDPPGQKQLVSIGYGHQIKDSEYKSGFIQAGNESIPISGERGINTVLSKTQSQKLLEMDLPKYEKAAALPLGEAWNKLNDEQKASLISYAYNTGGTTSLVKRGLKDAIMAGDFSKAGNIISEKGIRTAGGVENATLVKRRKHEGTMFASTSIPSVAPSAPSTGTAVASASTSVADGKMAAMVPTGGNTVINNKPVSVASASPSSGGKPGSTYDNELFQTLVGYQSSTA